jgi:hypothetical protein
VDDRGGRPVVIGALDPKPIEQLLVKRLRPLLACVAASEDGLEGGHQEGLAEAAGPREEIRRVRRRQLVKQPGLVSVEIPLLADLGEIS